MFLTYKECGEIKVVPHRCKGKFCSVCATGYMQEWSKKTADNLFNIPHRHIMFTIPDELWEIFLRRGDLLKNLMDLGAKFFQAWFREREKVTFIRMKKRYEVIKYLEEETEWN